MKSAREMFEDLGFEYKYIETLQPNGIPYHKEIKYFINGETIQDNYCGYKIIFILDKDNKNISRHYSHSVDVIGCGGHNYIDMPLLIAINKQIEELEENNWEIERI